MVALAAHDRQFLLFRPADRNHQPAPVRQLDDQHGGMRGAPADTMITS